MSNSLKGVFDGLVRRRTSAYENATSGSNERTQTLTLGRLNKALSTEEVMLFEECYNNMLEFMKSTDISAESRDISFFLENNNGVYVLKEYSSYMVRNEITLHQLKASSLFRFTLYCIIRYAIDREEELELDDVSLFAITDINFMRYFRKGNYKIGPLNEYESLNVSTLQNGMLFRTLLPIERYLTLLDKKEEINIYGLCYLVSLSRTV